MIIILIKNCLLELFALYFYYLSSLLCPPLYSSTIWQRRIKLTFGHNLTVAFRFFKANGILSPWQGSYITEITCSYPATCVLIFIKILYFLLSKFDKLHPRRSFWANPLLFWHLRPEQRWLHLKEIRSTFMVFSSDKMYTFKTLKTNFSFHAGRRCWRCSRWFFF